MKQKGINFRFLYLASGVIPMLVVAIVLSIYSISLIKSEVREGEIEKLKATADEVNEYFAYDIEANGDVDYDEYSDHVYMESLQGMDIEKTLFKGDTRLLTSLKNAEGGYNEGTQASEAIYKEVSSGKDYTDDNVDIGGKKYFVYYKPIYDGNGEFWGMSFAGTPMDNVNKAISKAVVGVVVILVVFVIIFTALIIIMSIPFTRTLNSINNDVRLLSAGNINNKTNLNSMCVEFKEIADSLSRLQDALCDAIGAIYSTSQDLTGSVAKVDELAVESADGAEQITNVIDQLAITAQSMAESVQDANESMIQIGQSIESISGRSQDASAKAREMEKSNRQAIADMEAVNSSNAKSVNAISQISEQAAACNEAVEKIKDAASTIADIASQTNLLALNASIEAARAGESGRGFAVVAENIRVLAEQSNQSASEIAQSVQDVVNKVSQCASMAVDAKKLMDEQKNLVADVTREMNILSDAVSNVADNVANVTDEATVLDSAKDKVLENITDLSAISEENAASAQEVTATIGSIANEIAGMKDESNQMNGMAGVLVEKIQFFS